MVRTESVKTIDGIVLDGRDEWENSVMLACKLGKKAFDKEDDIDGARRILIANYSPEKYTQAISVFEKIASTGRCWGY